MATEYYDGRDYRTGLRFTFCTSPRNCRETFLYRTDNVLDYMAPGAEGSALITVWESGSAVWTRAFRLTPNKASVLLERGAHFPPELTADAILIDTGWVPGPRGSNNYYPDKTEIWRWTGGRYKLISTVPFDRRYGALANLEHEWESK